MRRLRPAGPALPDGREARLKGGELLRLALALLPAILALSALLLSLARLPQPGIAWALSADGGLVLAEGSRAPALRGEAGQGVVAIARGEGPAWQVNGLMRLPSARWLTENPARQAWVETQQRLAALGGAERLVLVLADGRRLTVDAPPGLHLGPGPLLLAALVLLLYGLAVWVLIVRPQASSALFALITACVIGHLLFLLVGEASPLVLPPGWAQAELPLRSGMDLATAAATFHAALLHPLRHPRAGRLALLGWLLAGLVLLAVLGWPNGPGWLLNQIGVAGLGLAAMLALSRRGPQGLHPQALLLRRMLSLVMGAWLLLSVSVAASRPGLDAQEIAGTGSLWWTVFLASLLLLLPFLRDRQGLLHEFSLVAGAGTVAASLDLLFLNLLPGGASARTSLAAFLGVVAYLVGRSWLLSRLRGPRLDDTGRLFDALYQSARAAEHRPEALPELLGRLLQGVFDPLERRALGPQPSRPARVTLLDHGAGLAVPLPTLDGGGAPGWIELHLAERGRRVFTRADARLAAGLAAQLGRAIAHDRAVERGRREERERIAQDLHDDIGARLLTLMYGAGTPEREEYIRHTLQDLKTLTRGLATGNPRLGEAAADWKADAAHRLQLAGLNLHWQQQLDLDPLLSVAAWSALTRVLRELLSNAIAHARAQSVSVTLHCDVEELSLSIGDDGQGRDPEAWAPGLGLGGIRKRMRQLGGQVSWQARARGGIVCTVRLPLERIHAEGAA